MGEDGLVLAALGGLARAEAAPAASAIGVPATGKARKAGKGGGVTVTGRGGTVLGAERIEALDIGLLKCPLLTDLDGQEWSHKGIAYPDLIAKLASSLAGLLD